MTEPTGALDLAEIVEALRPYLPDLVETIGLAGKPTEGPDGKRIPGDVRAASIGLELVSKHLAGHGSDRASAILREALKARTEVSDGAESGTGADITDEG